MKNLKSFLITAISFGLGALTVMLTQCGPSTTNTSSQICMDFSNSPFYPFPFQDVVEDIERYNGTHVRAIETDMRAAGISKSASRSCTFPLDTVKKFIYYLEKYSEGHRLQSKDLAISFYYGVYPDTMISSTGHDYGSLHTLILIPAKFDATTTSYVEFNPPDNSLWSNYLSDVVSPPATAVVLRHHVALNSSTTSRSVITEPMAKNQGGLCPPNCPCPPHCPPTQQTLLSGYRGY